MPFLQRFLKWNYFAETLVFFCSWELVQCLHRLQRHCPRIADWVLLANLFASSFLAQVQQQRPCQDFAVKLAFCVINDDDLTLGQCAWPRFALNTAPASHNDVIRQSKNAKKTDDDSEDDYSLFLCNEARINVASILFRSQNLQWHLNSGPYDKISLTDTSGSWQNLEQASIPCNGDSAKHGGTFQIS